jgi:hypothetical protein
VYFSNIIAYKNNDIMASHVKNSKTNDTFGHSNNWFNIGERYFIHDDEGNFILFMNSLHGLKKSILNVFFKFSIS